MKRSLVLFLVLALAGVASAVNVEFQVAGKTANPDGSYTVAAGESIVIDLYSDTAAVGWGMGKIETNGAGVATSTVQNDAGWGNFFGGYLENTAAGVMISFAEGYETGATVRSGVLASFGYTVAAGWDQVTPITISSESGSYYSDGDQMTYDVISFVDLGGLGNVGIGSVTLVPEPMTIGLLGFGGLFLRRKNKK